MAKGIPLRIDKLVKGAKQMIEMNVTFDEYCDMIANMVTAYEVADQSHLFVDKINWNRFRIESYLQRAGVKALWDVCPNCESELQCIGDETKYCLECDYDNLSVLDDGGQNRDLRRRGNFIREE